uniref:Uncharacterized protein n=1 Tax=Oryza meridionalis TaxID=40149 RepID=A0A0E0CK48_9ORYZ
MAAAPILQGGRSTSADGDTISSALGVGEHLSIRIDTMRMREQEEAAPGVAVGRSAVTDAPAIQSMSVRPPSHPAAPAAGGNRSRLLSGLQNSRGSAIVRSGSDGAWPDDSREMKKLRAEMQGLVAVMRNFRTQARTYPKMNCIMKTLIPK